jgi:hypothetical protein
MADYTTPQPTTDIEELVPELAEFSRITTRLHPHQVTTDPPADQSKIGGMFLWPRDEIWPMCPDRGVPYVSVLQLTREDFPDVEFVGGTDLFQLLWTPYQDESTSLPLPLIFWRKAADISDPLLAAPNLEDYDLDLDDWSISENIPNLCTVHPERVMEYPEPDQIYWWAGLERAEAILEQIGQSDFTVPDEISKQSGQTPVEDIRKSYYWSNLSQCPGAKVGGGGSVKRDGIHWEHFITLPSWEYDAGNYLRWQPIEDRWESTHTHFEDLKEPMGMAFGRTQDVQIWICRETDPWQIKMNISGG